MQAHPFDILTLDNGAQIIFTPCPGTKKATINDSIGTLKAAGMNTLITLMFDEEMAENGASALQAECEKQDIHWVQLPILDDAPPGEEFATRWNSAKDKVVELLNNKGTVAVHCKGGSGRTGLVIGIILLALGWSGEKVIEEVQKIRPKALKNPMQLAYFNSYL